MQNPLFWAIFSRQPTPTQTTKFRPTSHTLKRLGRCWAAWWFGGRLLDIKKFTVLSTRGGYYDSTSQLLLSGPKEKIGFLVFRQNLLFNFLTIETLILEPQLT